MGKAVQFLLPEGAQYRRDLMPGICRARNFHFIIVQNLYPHREAGCEIVRRFAGGKLCGVYTVAQKSRQQTAHFPIALSGSKIFDDLISVLVRQQAGGQDLPEALVELAEVSRQKICNMAVPAVPQKHSNKTVLGF